MKRNWTKWTASLALAGVATLGSQSLIYAGGHGGHGGHSSGNGGRSGGSNGTSMGSMSRGSSGGSSFKSSNAMPNRSSSFSGNFNKGTLSSKTAGKYGDSVKSVPKGDFGKTKTRFPSSDKVVNKSKGPVWDKAKTKLPSDKIVGKSKGPIFDKSKTKFPTDKIVEKPKFPLPGGKTKLPIDKIVTKWPKGPVLDPGKGNGPIIDPGKGNGKGNHGNHGKHHHDKHHHHNHFPFHWDNHGWHWDDYYTDYHHHHHHYCPPVIVTYPFPTVCYDPIPEVVVVEHVVATPVVTEVVEVAPDALDVQLVEIRQVDAGNAEKQEGPLMRVLIRNNSQSAITQAFDVALVATAGGQPGEDSPYAMQKIDRMEGGQTLALDVRLPAESTAIGLSADGQPEPFKTLYGAVDVAHQLTETNEENNAAALDRSQIKPVDPSSVAVNG